MGHHSGWVREFTAAGTSIARGAPPVEGAEVERNRKNGNLLQGLGVKRKWGGNTPSSISFLLSSSMGGVAEMCIPGAPSFYFGATLVCVEPLGGESLSYHLTHSARKCHLVKIPVFCSPMLLEHDDSE